MFCPDLKGGNYKYEVLETDTQGRTLYLYTTYNIITGQKERALVVCQKATRKAVWFYEDICYLIGTWTSDEMEQLKERNDWNQTLNEEKMTRRDNKVSSDLFIVSSGEMELSKLHSICCQHFGINKSQILDLAYIDTDMDASTLYWLSIERSNDTEEYIVLVNNSGEIVSMKATGTLDDLTNLVEFKKNNFWGETSS